MKKTSDFLYSCAYSFCFLIILFVPFPYHLFPIQEQLSRFLFTKPLGILSPYLFHTRYSTNAISSDSTLMYTLVILILAATPIIALLLQRIPQTKKDKLWHFTKTTLFYFLALQLLKYGFDKVFKTQFYLPEPNTLYTPVGMLDKDILYWSTIGTSYSYNIFAGLLEVLAGSLLLFRRTRIVALILAIGIMFHVCVLNFSFDISVKLFSLFLLFVSVLLLTPYLKSILNFFLRKKSNESLPEENQIHLVSNKSLKTGIKFFVVGLIFIEALYPAITSGNFNDDKAERSFLHGAYQVKNVLVNDSLVPLYDFPFKRVFVHRNDYIIFQNQQDKMFDYKLEVDQIKKQLTLTDYSLKQNILKYSYSAKDSSLTFDYIEKGIKYRLQTQTLDWKKLPALKGGFHFRSDSGN